MVQETATNVSGLGWLAMACVTVFLIVAMFFHLLEKDRTKGG